MGGTDYGYKYYSSCKAGSGILFGIYGHTSYFLLLSKQRLNHRTTMLSISNFIGILALLLYFGSLILTLLAFLDKRTGENKNASPARLRHFLTIGLDLLY